MEKYSEFELGTSDRESEISLFSCLPDLTDRNIVSHKDYTGMLLNSSFRLSTSQEPTPHIAYS